MSGALDTKRKSAYGDGAASIDLLKRKVLRVVPAGNVYMETLLKIAALQWSTATETCAITCSAPPVMLFNKEFMNAYCRRDEDVLMVLLHELHHILYGHHALFKNVDLAHNVAFDAIINARLCKAWPERRYTLFFRKAYANQGFPEILLCPPPGWPKEKAPPDMRDEERRRLLRQIGMKRAIRVLAFRKKLYGQAASVSYADALSLFQTMPLPEALLLIGNHSNQRNSATPGNEGERRPCDSAHAYMVETARAMNRVIAQTEQNKADNTFGSGHGLKDVHPRRATPKQDFLNQLRKILGRAGVYKQTGLGRYRRQKVDSVRQTVTAMPNWRDRSAPAKQILLGRPPVLYASNTPASVARRERAGAAHVYVDVSGSMNSDLPWITGALRPLENEGLCRIFLFSTVVKALPRGVIGKGGLPTTGGTDIEPILGHISAMRSQERPRDIVILTDGLFQSPRYHVLDAFKKTGVSIHGAVTHCGSTKSLNTVADTMTQLPPYQ